MTDEAKEILSRSLVNQISQLQTERDALRAELAALGDSLRREARYRAIAEREAESAEAAIKERDALRAELAAERERKEHYQTSFKDMVPQAVALREALREARPYVFKYDGDGRKLLARIDALLADGVKENDDEG